LHPTGQWCKKIRGRVFYFGKDPDAALSKYLEERDDRQAGREPRRRSDGLTLRDCCNSFLTSKQRLCDTGELSPVTWQNYHDVCERLLTFFGKDRQVLDLDANDFERLRVDFAKTRGANALGHVSSEGSHDL
jgi:hypothetical protein